MRNWSSHRILRDHNDPAMANM
ncbi:hypothetical protein Atc_2024 [Acidithiobacillus caldus SM-1]|uniref:Uncharacterized protein n=1 Tax=Acidithiobacillus caldus (strain SM-1) TaxID=990288 RepID=F9ZQI3_ACICS|nr:hypothetical protein Atc_2024 [Acidithiobacillus caldus SM-1]